MNKFIFTLGVITFGGLIGALLVYLDSLSSGNFLNEFVGNELIQTLGVVLGLNVTATVFLLGQIYTFEKKIGPHFAEVRDEIRDNTYFLFIAFAISFILLTLRPAFIEGANFSANKYFFSTQVVLLAFLVLALYALFQLFQAAFLLSKDVETS